ncbi:hypothetical protein GCK72_020698 [Caenorhabditis remanei]|uniref:Uncharacterized protein n=1 Tax=Caenorhabditis remanei TaxID=31234 RepID=A0A6A5GG01_CAERE|nr:hypothetical protein GCK72_020698 [Caenorhabditis remanei]KAF1754138.1 hypothetical protein GCK72_020698 [Caenorhabditis remanei]
MVVPGEAEKSAMEIVNGQVTNFWDAMSSKKKDVILQLFNTTADDQKNVDEFMEKFQGIGITVESAMFNNNGGIESNVLIAEKIPGKVVMSKNPASPTGWKITQLGVQEPGSVGKRKWSKFSMCWIGLFWCAIEFLVDWGDAMNGRYYPRG